MRSDCPDSISQYKPNLAISPRSRALHGARPIARNIQDRRKIINDRADEAHHLADVEITLGVDQYRKVR
jgi:hypothetical protein